MKGVDLMYDVLSVCKFIISNEDENGRSVSNLRLQKLLYFIQGQFLIERNELCFHNEIEAWKYGPVVPDAYRVYKFYGSSSIQENDNDSEIDDAFAELIERTLEEGSSFTTGQLIEQSHIEGGPWEKNYCEGYKKIIPESDMRSFFRE